jgi:hypothetical protein
MTNPIFHRLAPEKVKRSRRIGKVLNGGLLYAAEIADLFEICKLIETADSSP